MAAGDSLLRSYVAASIWAGESEFFALAVDLRYRPSYVP